MPELRQVAPGKRGQGRAGSEPRHPSACSAAPLEDSQWMLRLIPSLIGCTNIFAKIL